MPNPIDALLGGDTQRRRNPIDALDEEPLTEVEGNPLDAALGVPVETAERTAPDSPYVDMPPPERESPLTFGQVLGEMAMSPLTIAEKVRRGEMSRTEAAGRLALDLGVIGGAGYAVKGARRAAQARKAAANARTGYRDPSLPIAAEAPETAEWYRQQGIDPEQYLQAAEAQRQAELAEEAARGRQYDVDPQGYLRTAQAEREAELAADVARGQAYDVNPEQYVRESLQDVNVLQEQEWLKRAAEAERQSYLSPQELTAGQQRGAMRTALESVTPEGAAEPPVGGAPPTPQRTIEEVLADAVRTEREAERMGKPLARFLWERGGLDLQGYTGGTGEQRLLLEQKQYPGLFNRNAPLKAHELAEEAAARGYIPRGENDADTVKNLLAALEVDLTAQTRGARVLGEEGADIAFRQQVARETQDEIGQVLALRGQFGSLEEATQAGLQLIEQGDELTGRGILQAVDTAGTSEAYRALFTDKSGKIIPGALFALGRSTIGAAVGASQGETPGEKLRNAMAGAMVGATLSPRAFKTFGHAVVAGEKRAVQVADLLGVQVRRFIGTRPGYKLPNDVASDLIEAESRGNKLAAGWKYDINLAKKGLSIQERFYLSRHGAEIKRGNEVIPDHMTGLKEYFRVVDQVWDDVWTQARARGLQTGYRENHFPQQLTPAAKEALLTQQGDLYEAIKREVGGPNITDDQLFDFFYDDLLTRRFGPIEKRRTLTLPARVEVNGKLVDVTNNSWDLIEQYLMRAGQRIGIAEVYGVDSATRGNEIAQQLAKTPGGMQAKEAFENAFRTLQGDPFDTALARGMARVQPVSDVMLGLLLTTAAPINVMAGPLQVIAKTGWGRFTRTALKSLAHTMTRGAVDIGGIGADTALAERVGAWTKEGIFNQLAYGFEEMPTGGRWRKFSRQASQVPARVTGLNWVNNQINKIGSVAGKDMLLSYIDLAKKGDGRWLVDLADDFNFTDAHIARWMREGANEQDIARIMQQVPARTNVFNEFAADVPRWAKHPLGRQFLAFTGAVRGIGNLSVDAVMQARRGNAKPLLALMGLPVAAGAERRLKEYLKGQHPADENQAGMVADALLRSGLMGLTGIVAEDAMAVAGSPQPAEEMFKRAIPPWLRQIDHLYQLVVGGDLNEVRRLIPVADMIAVQGLGQPSMQELRQRKRQ